jgi:hypothetical protein
VFWWKAFVKYLLSSSQDEGEELWWKLVSFNAKLCLSSQEKKDNFNHMFRGMYSLAHMNLQGSAH